MPKANKGQQKVPILKNTTGLCPFRSYYYTVCVVCNVYIHICVCYPGGLLPVGEGEEGAGRAAGAGGGQVPRGRPGDDGLLLPVPQGPGGDGWTLLRGREGHAGEARKTDVS